MEDLRAEIARMDKVNSVYPDDYCHKEADSMAPTDSKWLSRRSVSWADCPRERSEWRRGDGTIRTGRPTGREVGWDRKGKADWLWIRRRATAEL